jgi:hypothetical protein
LPPNWIGASTCPRLTRGYWARERWQHVADDNSGVREFSLLDIISIGAAYRRMGNTILLPVIEILLDPCADTVNEQFAEHGTSLDFLTQIQNANVRFLEPLERIAHETGLTTLHAEVKSVRALIQDKLNRV